MNGDGSVSYYETVACTKDRIYAPRGIIYDHRETLEIEACLII
jgi:hypothetical protein